MANDTIKVAASGVPDHAVDSESVGLTAGDNLPIERQRVRIGGTNLADLADVVTGDTGQGAQVVVGARQEVAFSTTVAATLASTDVSNHRSVAVQFTSQGTSSIATFQVSNDNVNWVSVYLQPSNATTGAVTGVVAPTTGIWTGVIQARYFRINVSGISAGTTAGVIEFTALPPSSPWINVAGTATFAFPSSALTPGDGANNANVNVGAGTDKLLVYPYGYNGSNWDRIRTPKVFKSVTATATGNTAVWTPTAGKKFRLMQYRIDITADVAVTGGADVDATFQDSASAIGQGMTFFAPTAAGSAVALTTGWCEMGNGYLSSAANNVLNINLSAALSAGKVRVTVCGTEE